MWRGEVNTAVQCETQARGVHREGAIISAGLFCPEVPSEEEALGEVCGIAQGAP